MSPLAVDAGERAPHQAVVEPPGVVDLRCQADRQDVGGSVGQSHSSASTSASDAPTLSRTASDSDMPTVPPAPSATLPIFKLLKRSSPGRGARVNTEAVPVHAGRTGTAAGDGPGSALAG